MAAEALSAFNALKNTIKPAATVSVVVEETNAPAYALANLLGAESYDLGEFAAKGERPNKYPIARISSNNWETSGLEGEAKEAAPSGKAPYFAVYLGARLGGTIWNDGGGAAAGGNRFPLMSFVLPAIKSEAVQALVKRTKAVANAFQYTPLIKRTAWDAPLGHFKSDLHLLVWQPEAGFIILDAVGANSSELTADSLMKFKPVTGQAYSFNLEIEALKSGNKNTNIKPASFVKFESKPEHKKIAAITIAFAELQKNNGEQLRTVMQEFITGEDFKGASLDEVTNKLQEYYTAGLVK